MRSGNVNDLRRIGSSSGVPTFQIVAAAGAAAAPTLATQGVELLNRDTIVLHLQTDGSGGDARAWTAWGWAPDAAAWIALGENDLDEAAKPAVRKWVDIAIANEATERAQLTYAGFTRLYIQSAAASPKLTVYCYA